MKYYTLNNSIYKIIRGYLYVCYSYDFKGWCGDGIVTKEFRLNAKEISAYEAKKHMINRKMVKELKK